MQVYELIPQFDARQSFYHKALIIQNADVTVLQSYNTQICEIKENTLHIYDNNEYTFSNTTLRHIKEFFKQYNIEIPAKNLKKWLIEHAGDQIKI